MQAGDGRGGIRGFPFRASGFYLKDVALDASERPELDSTLNVRHRMSRKSFETTMRRLVTAGDMQKRSMTLEVPGLSMQVH
jgi:hypothetical protein